jgi:hypothetical protein
MWMARCISPIISDGLGKIDLQGPRGGTDSRPPAAGCRRRIQAACPISLSRGVFPVPEAAKKWFCWMTAPPSCCHAPATPANSASNSFSPPTIRRPYGSGCLPAAGKAGTVALRPGGPRLPAHGGSAAPVPPGHRALALCRSSLALRPALGRKPERVHQVLSGERQPSGRGGPHLHLCLCRRKPAQGHGRRGKPRHRHSGPPAGPRSHLRQRHGHRPRKDGRIVSIATPDRPEGFKARGLCCGFVRVDRRLSPGDQVVLADARREIRVTIVTDIRPDRTARRPIQQLLHQEDSHERDQ